MPWSSHPYTHDHRWSAGAGLLCFAPRVGEWLGGETDMQAIDGPNLLSDGEECLDQVARLRAPVGMATAHLDGVVGRLRQSVKPQLCFPCPGRLRTPGFCCSAPCTAGPRTFIAPAVERPSAEANWASSAMALRLTVRSGQSESRTCHVTNPYGQRRRRRDADRDRHPFVPRGDGRRDDWRAVAP